MDTRLQQAMNEMTEAQLYEAIFTDHMTGAKNRRALDAYIDDSNLVAIIDLDSLKWLNDEINHRMGDLYLKTLTERLQVVFGAENVYRLSGDEMVVLGQDGDLYRELKILQRHVTYFSFGVGTDLVSADAALITNKLYREDAGLRAARGETPPWANKLLKMS